MMYGGPVSFAKHADTAATARSAGGGVPAERKIRIHSST